MAKDLQQQSEPIIEDYMNGVVPESEEQERKIRVPVVTTMTKYLFKHYRIVLYSFLNRELRTGRLERDIGFEVKNQRIDHYVCNFVGVTYWRIDRTNFWADVETTLTFDTQYGVRQWRGYLCLWFSCDEPGRMKCSVEELAEPGELDRDGLVMLSPYLVPYFTSRQLDEEAEHIWETYIPAALKDRLKRNPIDLAKEMGLSVWNLRLADHKGVNSILFMIDDEIEIEDRDTGEIQNYKIPANTIVINEAVVRPEYSAFDIYHECIHYEEHYLFFRLQEMHTNDFKRMETMEIVVKEKEKISNPIYWMEKQANRGGYGLMMPITDMLERIAVKMQTVKGYKHCGDKYEKVGMAIGADLHLPAFRVRARMIQLGHIHAKGALNYVDRKKIEPFSFDPESMRVEEHTFVIDRWTAGNLYERNTAFRETMDTGKYIYADGHIARNSCKIPLRQVIIAAGVFVFYILLEGKLSLYLGVYLNILSVPYHSILIILISLVLIAALRKLPAIHKILT